MKFNKKIPSYDFEKIEKKWQKKWQKEKLYEIDLDKVSKPFYNLMMFPYPSAEGLHIGGVYTFTGVDTFGRYKRMKGYDVFQPIGLDGFGIHSENYAMKIGEHILEVSKRTEKNFYRQLRSIGNMYDWSRTIETYKPNYYKWTQWIFLQLFKKGLAYQKKAKVNWCPWCKTVLSDEQVIGERCERCDSIVQKKELKQWFFKITAYTERLLKNLDWIDWPEDVKTNQRNWIGKSEGALIKFFITEKNNQFLEKIKNKKQKQSSTIEIFTTRPDTLFGATFLVLAPENSIIRNWQKSILNWTEVSSYIQEALKKSEEERKNEKEEKIGLEIKGIVAINPVTKKEIPVWVADYVLADYGTGAIMAVPAHDERDFQFAKKYGLPIRQVIKPIEKKSRIEKLALKKEIECFSGEGIVQNSDFINGLRIEEAQKKIIHWLEKNNLGKKAVNYKLRDWCVSRQRYWGPPIPIIWCEKCSLEKVKSPFLKNKKVKVLMIHGLGANGKSFWFPWMKKKLEKMDCKVFCPTIPDSSKPELEKWLKKLKPYLEKLDENSIIIGHSLGSKAALHLLEKSNKKIAQVFLVASALGNPKRDWNEISKRVKNVNIEYLRKFWEKKIDWKKLDKKVKEKFVIVSIDDSLIDADNYNFPQLSNLKIEFWNYHRHFKQPYNQKLFNFIISRLDKVRYPGLISLNISDQKNWQLLLKGEKSIETRALNPSEKERFFGNIKAGDKVIIRNIITTKERLFKVKNVFKFSNLNDFYLEKGLVKKTFPAKKIKSFSDLENAYRVLGSDLYVEKINKNGLIAFEVELGKEAIPVSEKDLPVLLPSMKDFLPEGKGKGPLAKNDKFVKTNCPNCGSEAQRETDVSDPFVDSAWYFFRYPSTEFNDQPFDKNRTKKWLPVDSYIGGKEHTVLHLLYSRFITMVFKDLGLIDFEEPYKKFFGHGLITKDGAKMSKSKGNVVNPDDIIKKYGIDTTRLYLRFLGDFSQGGDWRDSGIEGMARFVRKVWKLFFELDGKGKGVVNDSMIDKTIKVVGEDIEKLSFNTAVARIMEFINWIKENQTDFNFKQTKKVQKTLALVLAPFAPFLAEEFWQKLGGKESIFNQKWPNYNEEKIKTDQIELVIQVNGKLRDKILVPVEISKEEAIERALQSAKIQKFLKGKKPKNKIYVPQKLVNLVV